MSVCSCIPATMLDSQDESLTGFVQQSLLGVELPQGHHCYSALIGKDSYHESR
jgi:hypothetical protein